MSAFPGIVMSQAGNSSIQFVRLEHSALWQAPPAYALGFIVTTSPTANLTYNVQITADQVPSAGGNWNNHDLLQGLTASANSNVAFAITGYRLNVSSYTSGSVNLGVARWP
jgi:hypothetical protein